MPAPRVIVGALARALVDAAGDRLAAERAVVDFLRGLFPEWRELFPAERCWRWTPPHTIDVYGVLDSPAAIQALWLAGFTGGVTLHDHSSERLLTCSCNTHEAP